MYNDVFSLNEIPTGDWLARKEHWQRDREPLISDDKVFAVDGYLMT